jgi:putative membrane protein
LSIENQEEKFTAFLVIVTIISTIVTWGLSGWLLWQWLDVSSFTKGVIWFFAWGVVGGLAQAFIAPLPSVILMLVLSLFTENRS